MSSNHMFPSSILRPEDGKTCIDLRVSSCSGSCMSTFTHFPAFFFSLQVKSFKLKWQAEHMNHPPAPLQLLQ